MPACKSPRQVKFQLIKRLRGACDAGRAIVALVDETTFNKSETARGVANS
jgi:hypothetical protein